MSDDPKGPCPHTRPFWQMCPHCRAEIEQQDTEPPPPLDASSEDRLAWAKRIGWIRQRWS